MADNFAVCCRQLFAAWPCVEVENTAGKNQFATVRIRASIWSISFKGAYWTTLCMDVRVGL